MNVNECAARRPKVYVANDSVNTVSNVSESASDKCCEVFVSRAQKFHLEISSKS